MPQKSTTKRRANKIAGRLTKNKNSAKSVIDAILKGSSFGDYYEITAKAPATLKGDVSAPEGQLSVDVIETESEIIVIAAIAGVKAEEIEIAAGKDMLTIRGKREKPINIREENFALKECFWGHFSRTVILPRDVSPTEVRALFKNGILIVSMPKETPGKPVPIVVVDE